MVSEIDTAKALITLLLLIILILLGCNVLVDMFY